MASSIKPQRLPASAFLQRYSGDGGYADCFSVEVAGEVSLSRFIEAFYSSAVIKPELIAVGLLFSRPASNAQAKQLAGGDVKTFRPGGSRTATIIRSCCGRRSATRPDHG